MFKIIGAVVVYGFAIFGLVKAIEGRVSAQGSPLDVENAAG